MAKNTLAGKIGAYRLSEEAYDRGRSSTGSLYLDAALGGGIPHGFVTVAYGPPNSYKTTLAQMLAAKVLQNGKKVLWIATEATGFDWAVARKNGIDTDSPNFVLIGDRPDLPLAQRLTLELAVNFADMFCEEVEGAGNLIVVDSLSNLLTGRELAGDIDDAVMGAKARITKGWFARQKSLLFTTATMLFIIAHANDNFTASDWERKTNQAWKLSGGTALQHAADVKLRCWPGAAINFEQAGTGKKLQVGVYLNVLVEKNKRGQLYHKAVLPVRIDSDGQAVDIYQEVLEIGQATGLIEKSGAWYNVRDWEGKWQGETALRTSIIENTGLFEYLKSEIGRVLVENEEESAVDASDLIE